MIYLVFDWVLSGRLGSGWVSAGFWDNPAETQPGRWVAGWAARDFEKVFQNITSSLKCSRIARDNVTCCMMLRMQFGWFDLEDLIRWTASFKGRAHSINTKKANFEATNSRTAVLCRMIRFSMMVQFHKTIIHNLLFLSGSSLKRAARPRPRTTSSSRGWPRPRLGKIDF